MPKPSAVQKHLHSRGLRDSENLGWSELVTDSEVALILGHGCRAIVSWVRESLWNLSPNDCERSVAAISEVSFSPCM